MTLSGISYYYGKHTQQLRPLDDSGKHPQIFIVHIRSLGCFIISKMVECTILLRGFRQFWPKTWSLKTPDLRDVFVTFLGTSCRVGVLYNIIVVTFFLPHFPSLG